MFSECATFLFFVPIYALLYPFFQFLRKVTYEIAIITIMNKNIIIRFKILSKNFNQNIIGLYYFKWYHQT